MISNSHLIESIYIVESLYEYKFILIYINLPWLALALQKSVGYAIYHHDGGWG